MHIKRYFGMIPKKRPEATPTAFLDGNQMELFDFDYFMSLARLSFNDFRDIYLENSIFYLGVDLLLVGVIRQKHFLLDFAV